ncbi:hypothetical protein GCM10010433_51520 [Streptomyces pulveraceus]
MPGAFQTDSRAAVFAGAFLTGSCLRVAVGGPAVAAGRHAEEGGGAATHRDLDGIPNGPRLLA